MAYSILPVYVVYPYYPVLVQYVPAVQFAVKGGPADVDPRGV